jgi:hypothetical protein
MTEEHPGTVFSDGASGPRAALIDGPYVWEVMSVVLDHRTGRKVFAWYAGDPSGSAVSPTGSRGHHHTSRPTDQGALREVHATGESRAEGGVDGRLS